MSITNNKFLRRFTTAVLTGIMVVSMVGMNVSATGAEDTTFKFTKTLDMTNAEGANVPNVTFEYSITSGTAVDAANGAPKIEAGVGTPEIGEAEFANTDKIEENTVEKEVTVDFSDVVFPNAGIYRYEISELPTDNTDITNDETATRYLDVYVENTESGLVITHYILIADENLTPDATGEYGEGESSKSAGYTNKYNTYDLNLTKNVEGTMGEKNREFSFTINFNGGSANAGTSFTYNNDTITLDNEGKATLFITLSDEEEISIKGIPSTVIYEVIENINSTDGYSTTVKVNTNDPIESVSTGEITMGAQDNTVVVTNTRNAVNPTGVVMSIMPYALMVALAGVLAFMFLRRRRTNEF